MEERSIDSNVWHIDVDYLFPGAIAGAKGSTVRRLKQLSWVQTEVTQVGLYLLYQFRSLREFVFSTQGPR